MGGGNCSALSGLPVAGGFRRLLTGVPGIVMLSFLLCLSSEYWIGFKIGAFRFSLFCGFRVTLDFDESILG